MTDIKLNRLSLENFKCHARLTLDFHGGNASIYGDNATGKTSIYDALTWLLFGKDSAGNGEKNIEIKPLGADGDVLDHDAQTSVEAALLVNGEEITLRRTFREVWTTRRGSSEAVFDGNTSEYYIDGVPCKRNAFQDRVNDLVSEDTFRMLTSVSYFAKDISWQDRRAVLFRLVGIQDDKEIMRTNSMFQPLLDDMGRLGLDDYKKKLLSEKRGYMGAKTEIPARISECRKTIDDTASLDFAAAKAEVDRLQAKLDGVSTQILAIEHSSAAEAKSMEIREAQLQMTALENENKAYRASQNTGAAEIRTLKSRLTELQMRLAHKEKTLLGASKVIAGYDEQIEAARKRWIATNSEVFTGGTCPTCGQDLPEKQRKAAADAFEAHKKERLREIEQTAQSYKDTKADAAKHLEELNAEIKDLQAEAEAAAASLQTAEASTVEIRDMDGFAEKRKEIHDRITALSGELADINGDAFSAKEKLRREKENILAKIAKHTAIVSKESLLGYAIHRMEDLRQEAKKAAECLERLEKMLFLIDEYTRYKTSFVEDSINGMFRIARFRLFREQANGGIEDRCDVVLDGVPYLNINNGAKINVGIDIINTLSQAYGVKVPLFVDNAESVTRLEETAGQVIRLVVSEEDKELRVNYED